MSDFNTTAVLSSTVDLTDDAVFEVITDDIMDAVAGYSGVVSGPQPPFKVADGHVEVTITIPATSLREAVGRTIELLEPHGQVVSIYALSTEDFDDQHDLVGS